jgi:uncharacterized membrane protein
MGIDRTNLPPHVEEAIGSIAELHAEHSRGTSRVRLRIARLTRILGRPLFLMSIIFGIAAWMLVNVAILHAGGRPFDSPPFPWLQGTVSGLALIMTILIVSTQQRDDAIGDERDQLTLQLAMLSEQKLTKLIGLLEDLRRDDPHVADRPDVQAAEMAVPTNPLAMSEAIKRKIEPDALGNRT